MHAISMQCSIFICKKRNLGYKRIGKLKSSHEVKSGNDSWREYIQFQSYVSRTRLCHSKSCQYAKLVIFPPAFLIYFLSL